MQNAIHLVRASQIIRREIFANKYAFTDGCEENIVPQTLKALVSIIVDGPTIEDQSHRNTAKIKAVLSLSELIMYNNCVKKCANQDANTTRHIRDRESPLAIYLSLLVHAQTRTRDNVDTVHNWDYVYHMIE